MGKKHIKICKDILKACKSDNFESRNFLKVSFTNIWVFNSNCVGCESSYFPDILTQCETNFGWLNWFWQFIPVGFPFFNLKGFCYSYAWSCNLCGGATSFCVGLIFRKLEYSYLHFQLDLMGHLTDFETEDQNWNF